MEIFTYLINHPVLQYFAITYLCVHFIVITLKLLGLEVRQCIQLLATGLKDFSQWLSDKLTDPEEQQNSKHQKATLYVMAAVDYLFAWYFVLYASATGLDLAVNHPNLPFLNQMGILGIVVALFIAARFYRVSARKEEYKARQL